MKRTFVYDPENPRREAVLILLAAFVRDIGRKVIITITDPTRTLEQNARMWAMLGDVSKQVQWPVDGKLQWLDPEDWKDIFTAGLRQEARIAQGINGGFVFLGLRTSRMSKRQMGDLMELMSAFGAERGIAWSEPPVELGA